MRLIGDVSLELCYVGINGRLRTSIFVSDGSILDRVTVLPGEHYGHVGLNISQVLVENKNIDNLISVGIVIRTHVLSILYKEMICADLLCSCCSQRNQVNLLLRAPFKLCTPLQQLRKKAIKEETNKRKCHPISVKSIL